MAKKNNALETIKEKQIKLSVIESVIRNMSYDMENILEGIADHEANLSEYTNNYDEDAEGVPLEQDWRYNDYLETIADARLRAETYENIQQLLLKLV